MVNRGKSLLSAIHYLILGAVLLSMLFPLAWMFRVALTSPSAGLSWSSLLTGSITLQNFADLFSRTRMGWFLLNSIAVGTVVTVGNVLFCFMVAFALARYRTLANRWLFVTIIGVLMIPAHITIIPLYLLCVKTGMFDTFWALTLPWLVTPIGIFLVKQYIEGIPPSMEEAARIDGAGELRILFTIVMPICRPAMAVLAIQVFFTNWNSFLFPYILTSDERLRTLPVGLALLQGHQAIDWPHLMAGSTVAVLPVLILFFFVQKRIVSGITAGALKQ